MKREDFSQITVILRGYDEKQIQNVAEALLDSSIRTVEITLNTQNALKSIEKIKQLYGDRLHVGAGTVLTMEDAENAIHAGAKFLLSPILLDKSILHYAKENGVLTVPGAYTPTEIISSFRDGADIVKVFPATALPLRYVPDISAPLGQLPLMAVGGVNRDNMEMLLKNGYAYLGIGSGIFEKSDILAGDKRALRQSVKDFEKLLNVGGN